MDGPYAPLRRHGDYVAVGKSEAYREAEKAGDQDALEKIGNKTLAVGGRFAAYVMRHEVMHVIDDASHGGIYSELNPLKVIKGADGPVGVGAVARELINASKNSDSKLFRDILDYPLSKKFDQNGMEFAQPSPQWTRRELFAQVGAMLHDDGMRAILEREAPQAAKFFTQELEYAKSQKPFEHSSEQRAGELASESRSIRAAAEPGSEGLVRSAGAKPESVDASEHIDISKYLSANRAESFRPDSSWDADRRGVVDRVASKLPKDLQGPARSVAGTLAQGAKRGIQTLSFGHDLADASVNKGLKTAKAYMDLFGQKGAYKADLDKRLGDIGYMASKLSASERARVSEYLTDSTAEQKWGHTPCWKEVKTDPEYEARYKQFSPDAGRHRQHQPSRS